MNPFGKSIELLEGSDIQRLISSGFSERKSIDYKRKLPDFRNNHAKSTFLDDVSAFANGAGGCVVYGVMEKGDGVPASVSGVGEHNFDQVKRQLEEIARAHIRPRISPQISLQEVPVGSKYVFVVYAPRSWRAPHMAMFPPENNRFIVRTAAGNHRMDVDDLRAAFLGQAGVEGQIQDFRLERLSKIVSMETPYPLVEAPTLAVHVVPFSAFDPSMSFAPDDLRQFRGDFEKIYFGSSGSRYNLDGFAFAHGAEEHGRVGYAQLFRTGAMEFLDRSLVQTENGVNWLYIYHVEEFSIQWLGVSLDVLRRLGIEPPVVVMASLLGVRGCRLKIESGRHVRDADKRLIDRDDLLIAPQVVESFSEPPATILHPVMDSIWQAAGWPRSHHFNDNHEWKPRG